MLYNRFEIIGQELLAKGAYIWQNLSALATPQTIYRNNWILLGADKLLITQETYGSHGAISWNYIQDEWCFLANCLDYLGLQQYYGLPFSTALVIQENMDSLSFVLNSSLIYDQLKQLHFSEHYKVQTVNDIQLIDAYTVFDFGVNTVKTDLELNHNPVHEWVSLEALDERPFHNLDLVKQVLATYSAQE